MKFFVFSFFSFLILFLSTIHKAQAWDPTFGFAAASYKQGLETIYEKWDKTMLATMKSEMKIFVFQEFQNTTDMIFSRQGIAGVVMGQIESWTEFLTEEPGNQAASYLEEVLSKATGGRSELSYVSKVKKVPAKNYSFYRGSLMKNGGSNEGFINTSGYVYDDHGTAYRRELRFLKLDLIEQKKKEWSVVAEEPFFETNPRLMLKGEDLRTLDIYLSDINNPWSYAGYQNTKLEHNYQIRQTELLWRALIGRGYIAPSLEEAKTMANFHDKLDTWDLELLMGAESGAEILTYSALVSVNGVLKASMRNVRKSYQKDLAAYRENILTKIKNELGQYNPGELFKDEINAADARHDKFNTGYDYENKNTEEEANRRNEEWNNYVNTGLQGQQ